LAKRLTDFEKALRRISERDWQSQVIKFATIHGWKHYHPPDNKPVNGRIQKVVSGFPDLVLVKKGRLIFAELKRELGVLSPDQMDWLEELRQCNLEVYVWRPSDVDEVVKILGKK